MTSREVITAIVKHKLCPERMGLHESFWQDTQQEWEKQGLPAGINMLDYFNLDVREIQGSLFRTTSIPIDDEVVEEDEQTVIKVNGWGAKFREWKNKPGVPEHISFDLTHEDIWKKKYRDNLLGLDLRRFPDLQKLKENYCAGMASDRFCVYYQLIIFEIMRKSMGDLVLLEAMYLSPRWIRDFCDVVTNHIIMHLEYIIREVGKPDGVWLYEDMGYTKAPFVSPALYKEFIFPYHKRVADFIHSYDLPFIMHSCGRIRPLLPHLVDAGIDGLQALEAKAGQHVVEMAEATGNKIAFMGNLDIRAFESNDRQTLEAEIIPKLTAVREKRIPYVFFSDHSIPKSVKLETYRYALDLHKKFGRY